MKKILLDPIVLPIILLIGIIYVALLFNAAGTNKKFSITLEKVLVGIFAISIVGATGATITPFDKLNPSVMYGGSTTMPTISLQLLIYATAILIISSRVRDSLKKAVYTLVKLLKTDPCFCLFLVLIAISAFWSETPSKTFKASLVYLEVTIIGIYVGMQYTWRQISPLFRWINLVVLILCLYYGFFKPSIGVSDLGWQGIIGHKNQFSFYMALTAVLWALNAIYNSQQRRLSIVVTLISIFALQKGGSGASKVLTVVMLSLWGYLGFVKKLKIQWAFVSIILFLIVSVCLSILITENIEFLVVDTLDKDLTITGRTDFWPIVIDKINSRPIFGYGIVGFWQDWRGLDNPAIDVIVGKTQFRPPHAHNGFLDLGLDMGWLGVALYVITFFSNVFKSVIYLSREALPESGLPLLLLTYTLMTNLTETGIVGVTSIWFWFVVMTVRLSLDATSKEPNNPPTSSERASLPLSY